MTSIKVGAVFEGIIEKLSFGGKALLHRDNFVIFIKGGIPEQHVKYQIAKKKKNYAVAKIIAVVKPSPLEGDSPHETMPGCTLQNIRYEDQLKIKEQQVFESLSHIGSVAEYEALPIVPSPETIRYRNKVEFSFGYETMRVEREEHGKKIFHDENPSLGFHPEGKWALVQPMKDCFLASERANIIRKIVEDFMKQSKYAVWNPKIHRGFWRQLLIREGKNTRDLLINIVVSEAQDKYFWEPLIKNIIAAVPSSTGIMMTVNTSRNDSLPPSNEGENGTTLLWGKDFIYEKLEDVLFQISPFAFFQTNTLGAEKLFATVRKFAELQGSEKILDLFCGSGAIGLFLAKNCSEIVGLEVDDQAVKDARHNAQLKDFTNTEYFCGKAEELLPDLLAQHPEFDVMIIDPPRAGMHPKAVETLLKIPASKMVFVSCNPTTLARDLALLKKGGWKTQKVQPVDMFPHTPHIETVVQLTKM